MYYKKSLRTLTIVSVLLMTCVCTTPSAKASADNYTEIAVDVVVDKIRGGLLGQILGNLNGIPHEMRYIDEPGDVTGYTPGLAEGARTDDDTDFEWVYIYVMQKENNIYLSSEKIAELWQERINERIWCSNRFARHLMDLGIKPPYTGKLVLNPWAEFNISGQFLCETFGLLAPAMPQTAAKIGLNYTTVAIDYEPAQTTQLFTTMIAVAFEENDIEKILDAGAASLDSKSTILTIMKDVRAWHREYPDDWRATRRSLRDKYTQAAGGMRDKNGHELNTGAVIGALLYGDGDFAETLRMAFNFGWDADNVAATAGTIVGVTKGYKWMMSQGWQIVDRYKNTTRDNMPADETITSFADRLVYLAEKVIAEGGGKKVAVDSVPCYRIAAEQPGNVQPLPNIEEQTRQLTERYRGEIEEGILRSDDQQVRARSAYLAVCLDLAQVYEKQHPKKWRQAKDALGEYWKVMQNVFHTAMFPGREKLEEKFKNLGFRPKTTRELDQEIVWTEGPLWSESIMEKARKLRKEKRMYNN